MGYPSRGQIQHLAAQDECDPSISEDPDEATLRSYFRLTPSTSTVFNTGLITLFQGFVIGVS